jgi:hypothetical protein
MCDNGDPPVYRAWPAFPQPTDHAADANAAALSLYKLKMDRGTGEDNVADLKALFLPVPHYSLAPRQTVDAILAKHG